MDQEGIPVFITSHRHAATAPRTGRRIAAGAVSVALATGFALAGATTAHAADGDPVATADAQFLSGTLLGTDLDNVVSLEGAHAEAHANDSGMTVKDPLEAKALNSIQVGDGSSVQTSIGGVVQLGAVGQYATAAKTGASAAETGGVQKDGGVGIGQDQSMPGGDATVDLSKLLGSGFASNIADLKVAIGAAAAQAVSDGKKASGDYSLADVDLKFTSPAVSKLIEKVDTALDSVSNRLSNLDGSDGALVADLNKALIKINPALNLLGGNAHVTASIDTGDLKALVQNLLTTQYGSDGVTFDLETGVVTLNLEKLLGKNLNDLAPGTELVDASILNPVLNSVTTKVSGIADQVVGAVKDALNNATVTLHADFSQNVAQAPLVQNVCQLVNKVIQVPTQVVQQVTIQVPVINGIPLPVVNGVPQLNGVPVVGSLVGKVSGTLTYITQTVNQTVTKLVDQTVTQNVCSDVSTPLPALTTSLTANISGTVNEFLTGAGVHAAATAKVLGVTVPVSLNGVIGNIAGSLNGQLFDSDSAVTDLVNALNTGLVNPAVQALTGDSNSVAQLADVLSVKVNNQDISNGTFTETAVEVRVLPGLTGGLGSSLRAVTGGSVAQINLARASVGPNVIPGEVGGVDTNPPSDGNPGNPVTTAGNIARLATTGVGIAALVAAVLALLAAGAYLVRESYRRNHSAMAR
jgi:hypothetical protein